MKYELLWVDDDWMATPPSDWAPREQRAQGERRERLEHGRAAISGALAVDGVDVEWTTDTLVSNSITRLHATTADFRLAVVDLDFGKTEWSWQILREALTQAHIPVVFFTAFPDKLAPFESDLRRDVSCIGVFEKRRQDEEFIHRVVAFCKAPPFRVVHISDLHFDSSLREQGKQDEFEEQLVLLTALAEQLAELGRKRPIDVMAFTGDFAHHSPANDLKEMRPFISELIRMTVTHAGTRRCLAIPGNHDMAWTNYGEGKLARQAWADYADFHSAVFAPDEQSRADLRGWDDRRRLLDSGNDGLGLCWTRRLSDPHLSVVGLVSPTDQPRDRGTGLFRSAHRELLKAVWNQRCIPGEVRLCLMHHNLMAPVSLSRLDERTTIREGGAAMMALLEHDCHVVLSGHVHTDQIVQFASVLGDRDEERMASLLVVGTGATGGTHPSKDRPRTFTCLEFGDGINGSRSLSISRFRYVPAYQRWKEERAFNVF